MKKTTAVLFLAVTLGMIISCSRWRVSNLTQKPYSTILAGKKAGQVKLSFDSHALKDLSFGIGIFGDHICVADNEMKRIQILEADGTIDLVIGSLKGIDTRKVKGVPFRFGTIGSFTIDSDDTIYVQNRLPMAPRRKWSREEEMNFSPSYILVFDKKGKLQHTLGKRGTPDIPFYYIDHLVVDEKERLFVISRSFDTWSVYRFDKKKRDFHINLKKLQFHEKDGEEVYEGKIENVKIYQSGETIMISVAYYHKRRLKYRKVYDYSIQAKKLQRAIVNIPDPKNVLFNVVDDKHIYFWNLESSEAARFMICNMEGNIINNVELKMDTTRYFYTKILADRSGHFYSYHVDKKGIKIYEWE